MGTGGGVVVGVRLRRRHGYCNLFVKIRIVSGSKNNKDKKKHTKGSRRMRLEPSLLLLCLPFVVVTEVVCSTVVTIVL